MMYLCNAFSFNFFAVEALTKGLKINAEAVSPEYVAARSDVWESAIGHQSTADVVSGILGVPVEMNRVNLEFAPGQQIFVAQYKGPRLPEGSTTLPEGATLIFLLVTIE